MKRVLILLVLLLPFVTDAQEQKYSRVKIFTGEKPVSEITSRGFDVSFIDPKGKWVIAELSEQEMDHLSRSDLKYEVVIEDMSQYYQERNRNARINQQHMPGSVSSSWPVPQHFSLGSCGGFSTIDEMLIQLDLMQSLYPDLITVRQPMSDTVITNEGRPVYFVKISDNPNTQEQEPQVLYTGMHHAREPIGMQHLIFFMWYLLENYDTDPTVKALVDNLELYFIPVFNPDGYQYNIDNFPNGGGMWRKNRRNSGNGNFGVDINRNYGYMWGINNTGSSPDPASETYRGTAPFSEPENRMMKYFCENHNFLIALNYHSYANKLLYAWGYTANPTPDDIVFSSFADFLTSENNYIYGPGYTTIYATNGGSDDWMYGEQTTKSKIFAYTPEVGGQDDGFWPVEERIIPLCIENMFASLSAAKLAGIFARITDKSPLFVNSQQGYLNYSLQRLGLTDGAFTISVQPLSSSIINVNPPKTYQGLQLLQKLNDSIGFTLGNNVIPGDTLSFVLTVSNGWYETHDTMMRIYGIPVQRFADKFDNNLNWNGMYWGTTTSYYYSPSRSMTDSPYGNYYSGANYSISLTNRVFLPQALLTVLEFRARWNIEPDYDYVQVKISRDHGLTWIPLQGRFTHPGGEYQLPESPLYDGTKPDWVHEIINLNEYMGDSIQLRFTITSDYGVQYDGFYFDDLVISQVYDYTSNPKPEAGIPYLGPPIIDATRNLLTIEYRLNPPANLTEIFILNPEGQEVASTKIYGNQGTARLNIGSLTAGIYVVTIKSKNSIAATRKFVLVR